MANFTWNYWVLQGSGWAIGYQGSGSAIASRDIGSDTATVTGTMKITCLGGDAVTWTMHMKVGSTTYTYTTSAGHTVNQEYTMTISEAISVGSDAGSLSVKLWMTIDGFTSYPGGTSATKSATLQYGTKGASTITSVTNVTIGNAPTIKWTPLASTFQYRLRFVLGDWVHVSEWISPASTSEYTYNSYAIPLEEELLQEIPTSRTGSMIVVLYSYDSNRNKLGTNTKTFTVTVPDTVAPTITSVSISGQDETFNEYLVGYSALTLTCVAEGIYGSYPSTVVFAIGNSTYVDTFTESEGTYSVTFESPELSQSGNITIVTTVTDSRGLTAVQSDTITVYDYHPPQIDDVQLAISDENTTATITVTGSISPVNNLNDKYIQVTMTRISDSTVVDVYPKTALDSYDIDMTFTPTISDIESESYIVEVTLFDSKYDDNGVSATRKTGIVCVSRLAGGLGLAIFREATVDDYGRVGIKGRIKISGRATDDDPTGYLSVDHTGVWSYRQNDTKAAVIGRTSTGVGGLWLYDSDEIVGVQMTASGGLIIQDANQNVAARINRSGIFTGALNTSVIRNTLVTVLSGTSLAGDAYASSSMEYTPADGYYPIGIVGYELTTSDGIQYARYMNVYRMTLAWASNKPYIFYSVCNTGTNTRSITLKVRVLEIKTS